jgi:putative ABC transport system ATP-binding protein
MSRREDTAVLELTGVGKTYQGSPPVHALAGVQLRIGAGELVAVRGPSGSGKSTLLHILGTLERPSSGIVRIGGREVSGLTDAELSAVRGHRIGFVFQRFFLLDHLDAVENAALGLLYRGGRAADRRQAAMAALARVGLAHRLGHHPAALSGGERQRVAIARAVAGRPAVVLADEPTGNLDTAAGQGIVELLAELARDGTAVVVVTHDPGVAAAMDRQVEMRDGRIITDTGPPARDRPSALPAGAPPARAGDAPGGSPLALTREADK